MKYLKRFENFSEQQESNFTQGDTVICNQNFNDTFKKGTTFKVNKIENGTVYLGDDNIELSLEDAEKMLSTTEVNFSRYDRREDYSSPDSETTI